MEEAETCFVEACQDPPRGSGYKLCTHHGQEWMNFELGVRGMQSTWVRFLNKGSQSALWPEWR